METLEQQAEENKSSKTTKAKTLELSTEENKVVLFPSEIIEEILSRLPVKSILRFKSVSKPWLSLINNPSFTKLQYSRATVSHRTGLLISAYYFPTRKRYYLSAHDGEPLTRLMTVDEYSGTYITGVTHLNGFVCYNRGLMTLRRHDAHLFKNSQAFLFNPSTRKTFELPLPDFNKDTTFEYAHMAYLFWFDDSTNEFKILLVRRNVYYKRMPVQIFIFSMSSRSWKKVDAEPPAGFSWERLSSRDLDGGVCVNSVVHIMLQEKPYGILAFDFITEKFSFVSIPHGVVHRGETLDQVCKFVKLNKPSIMKIDGGVGVVFHDQESSEVNIWLSQDYDNCVWVKETIKFPESWNKLVGEGDLSIDVSMDDEIVFSVGKVSGNVMIVPVYNRKSKCFKSLQFTLNEKFMLSKSLKLKFIKCYVESIMTL